jgi:hypothetical protein
MGFCYAISYKALMTGEPMHIQHWSNNNDVRNLKYQKK